MSRRYCKVCGAAHSNGALGTCDQHLEFDYHYVEAKKAEADKLFADFMEMDEEERWRRVFDAIGDRLS